MSRAISRSFAVVALLAVVSATLVVVTPSLARIVGHGRPHHAPPPAWLWESHVYGGTTAAKPAAKPTPKPHPKPHATRWRHPYTPPVARSAQP
jgi:hypothetical protein